MDYSRIFSIGTEEEFRTLALEIFELQYQHCNPYREFCDYLKKDPEQINSIEEIPFLPVELFKQKKILSNLHDTSFNFRSSGTTGEKTSLHYVADLELYRQSFRKTFELFYGDIRNYCVLALLPSYLERKDSSLVYMVQDLIEGSQNPHSGFYLDNYDELALKLEQHSKEKLPLVLIGVSFALLDLAEQYPMDLSHAIVMETGGMKGRRKEMIRSELHTILKKAWRLNNIHSEYGMTELLSQAYSDREGVFSTPPWMRVLIRDTEDPFYFLSTGRTGGINVIDFGKYGPRNVPLAAEVR